MVIAGELNTHRNDVDDYCTINMKIFDTSWSGLQVDPYINMISHLSSTTTKTLLIRIATHDAQPISMHSLLTAWGTSPGR